MDKGLYVAMTGASASLRAQGTVAHNLANIATAGFKAALANTQSIAIAGAGWATRVNAMPESIGFDSRQGAILHTGRPLDIALGADHWLAVQGRDGQEAFTRNGSLQVTPNGQLLTASGAPVLGEAGPIAIPPNQQITIGADGTISITPTGQGPETIAIVGRLRIVNAAPQSLIRGDDGFMRSTTGTPEPAAGNVLTSGAFEGSNVNAADMLVEMIELSRQFEMQVKILDSGDENARAANSLLKLG